MQKQHIDMKVMPAILIIQLWILLPPVQGQVKSIGSPEIMNFERKEYGADSQNWGIIQDSLGNIYVGNKAGVLRFDGEDWVTIPVSNRSTVRSLANGQEGKIYVGAYREIGVIEHTPRQTQEYRSLSHLVPLEARDYDDVWKIFQTRFGIIFQSFEHIFIYQDDSIRVLTPGQRFGFSFYVNNNYYVVEKGIGLRRLANGDLVTVCDNPLFTEDEIHLISQFRSNDLLVGTLGNGFHVLRGDRLERWETMASSEMEEHKLYCGTRVGELYLLGTIRNGLYIMDKSGTIINRFNRSNGMQNSTVLSLYVDFNSNIWAGLDNGIDLLKVSLPISYLDQTYNIETTYATVQHGNRLYVGTNQGLFTKRISELYDYADTRFQPVVGTHGQVWSLSVQDGQLLCGHNSGAFLIEGTRAKRITDGRGVWNFHTVPDREDLLISGTYDGLIAFVKDKGGTWQYAGSIRGFDISSRDLVVEEDGIIWIGHEYLGLYRLECTADFDSIVSIQTYFKSHQLPGELPYLVHQVGNSTIFSTPGGIFEYDAETNLFFKPTTLNRLFELDPLLYLIEEDHRGNYWYTSSQGAGLLRLLEDGTYSRITSPFMEFTDGLMNTFDNLYIRDPDNIFLGTRKGVVHYDPRVLKDYYYDIRVAIRSVVISRDGADSLWYGSGNTALEEESIETVFSLPFSYNHIRFGFNCTDLENTGKIQYRYRLLQYEEEWSGWTTSNQKEYMNLREGHYTFEVQARNPYRNISSPDRFSFVIDPPFRRSRTALILYLIFVTGFIALGILLILRRIEKVRSQEKARQKEVYQKKEEVLQEQKIAAEKEVTELRNEKLLADMKHKNKELAISTYHIIQKNKFLNSLKVELSKLSNSARSEFVEKELRKISHKIDRDIDHKKHWEVFDRYLDEVHQEFLVRLRELHPDLTPKEIRLSAYLRMNISTKEIAPLMNISVRGVEISRYRLRKKLGLDRDVNLTEYIMQIL